jgi:cysteine desulfurase family protein (TIGR01976 family)
MTTLTFAISRALARAWSPGDEVVVTRLDHDANVTPWRVLEERGIVVHECGFHTEDCTLDMEELASLIGARTRLVAVGHACNSVGTVHPLRKIADMAHAAGARLWVDAVHSAPHLSIDVQAIGADYLLCSAYKFFGPHVGVFWARREHMDELTPYRVRPAPAEAPDKFETGTPAYELLAATTAAVDYIAAIGRRPDAVALAGDRRSAEGRRADLERALATIRVYEQSLVRTVLEGLGRIPGVRIFGITDLSRLDERCPTVAFRVEGVAPSEVAERLGERGICLWDGNQYALGVTRGLGIEDRGGFVRIGVVHYNTTDDVERFLHAVEVLAKSVVRA